MYNCIVRFSGGEIMEDIFKIILREKIEKSFKNNGEEYNGC